MDKAPPTSPILGQVLREVKFVQVTFNVLLPCSPRSTSASLALHYDAFDPSYWGVMGLSLHTRQTISTCSPAYLQREVQPLISPWAPGFLSYPSYLYGFTTYPPQYTHFCYFHPLFENFLYGPIFCPIQQSRFNCNAINYPLIN